jgi:hypothetical protein
MKDVTIARLQSTEYLQTPSPPPPSIKYDVLRESLSEDSQKIPCATLKKKGVVGISLVLPNRLVRYVPETVLIMLIASLTLRHEKIIQ